MKKISIILSLLIAVAIGKAQIVKETKSFSEVNKLVLLGSVENPGDEKSGTCKVELFYKNTLMDSLLLTDEENTFEFHLQKDENYAIRISKEGYVSRIIFIDSSVPLELKNKEPHMFEFTTKLIKLATLERSNRDESYIPRIVIYFDNKLKSFYFYKDRLLTANKDFPYPYKRFDFNI